MSTTKKWNAKCAWPQNENPFSFEISMLNTHLIEKKLRFKKKNRFTHFDYTQRASVFSQWQWTYLCIFHFMCESRRQHHCHKHSVHKWNVHQNNCMQTRLTSTKELFHKLDAQPWQLLQNLIHKSASNEDDQRSFQKPFSFISYSIRG